jgi:hypothetical protein
MVLLLDCTRSIDCCLVSARDEGEIIAGAPPGESGPARREGGAAFGRGGIDDFPGKIGATGEDTSCGGGDAPKKSSFSFGSS